MSDQFTLHKSIQAKPEQVINTWLDSRLHTAITGGNYQVEPIAGGRFTAWDGYISGTFIDIESPHRVSMHWRASEFPENAPDSLVKLTFEDKDDETLVTLNHSNIPDGLGESYRQGWINFYLDPLVKYYTETNKKKGNI